MSSKRRNASSLSKSTLSEPLPKRRRKVLSVQESPPASRGLELEIAHAPQPFYPPPTPPQTPKKVRLKGDLESPVVASNSDEFGATTKQSSSIKIMSPAKLKILQSLGTSPYPEYPHPTQDECKSVNDALTKAHGERVRPKELNPTSLGANCGEVPSVLDALVRTILSQNTNNKNSSIAKRSLDKAFGLGNYEAIRTAPLEKVVDALRCGGLANIKGARIKHILDEVYGKHGKLSLDHLHDVSDQAAKEELMQFDGVGPKTASCVLLFCLRRESFAVDTHVARHSPICIDKKFRITKALGWIPPKANREQAFAHLDARIPENLKYSLHTLIITHGRKCSNCAARGMPGNRKVEDLVGGCPLRSMLKTNPVR